MKPNAMTNKRNYKQDFDNQLAMFYPGFRKYGLIFYPRYFENGSLEPG